MTDRENVKTSEGVFWRYGRINLHLNWCGWVSFMRITISLCLHCWFHAFSVVWFGLVWFGSVVLTFDTRSTYRLSKCAFWHCQIDLLANFDRWKQFRDVRGWRNEKRFVSSANTCETRLLSHRFIGIYRQVICYRHVIGPTIGAACMTAPSNCCFPRFLIAFAGISFVFSIRRIAFAQFYRHFIHLQAIIDTL
jgi:hypothetical protein